MFLGGAAYKQCQINKNSFNDSKTINDDGQEHSQEAGRDIINNSCDPTTLATLTAANFEVSLKRAYDQFEQKATENLYNIINETLQGIWAKVLAKEVSEPESFSFKFI